MVYFASSTIQGKLAQLGMYADGKAVASFRWVKEKGQVTDPYIRLALEKADEYDVDAVYFRFFEGNRPPIPQIYIYDYTNNKSLDQQAQTDIAEKQRRIWSSCQVPLFYIITKTNIQIFNTYQKPQFDTQANVEYKPYQFIDLLALADDINQYLLEDFSARSFDSGAFWEKDKYRNDFLVHRSAYESLIAELRHMRRDILPKTGLDRKIAHRLLVTAILIKYLEEREDEEGKSVFPKAGEKRRGIDTENFVSYDTDFFSKYASGAKEFVDVLRAGDVIQLYHDLGKHFNGKVFQLSAEEESIIKKSQSSLPRFANFLEGNVQKGSQLTLWRMYSFKDLPAELISNIYEEFIEDKSDGIVYTPPFLVNFLLDEVLPLTDTTTEVKILDPACGSGIFLVQAYKRLIYRWRSANDWKQPNLDVLKSLLQKNIYGVDIKEDAVKLAIFSLTVALCDELSPLEIWNNLRFDDLEKHNLQGGKDFFLLIQSHKISKDFDLVVGNPPFVKGNKWSEAAKQIENIRVEAGEKKIPGKELALLFLDQAVKHTKQSGNVCLILPSGPFLYNLSSFSFREQILKTYNLEYIADFTHLSRFLFGKGKGDHPVLAAFIKNEPPTEEDILHITVRRTKTAKSKVWFELDHYDFHRVPRGTALNSENKDKVVWKSNFIGGGRIYSLISRLTSIDRCIGSYINEKNNHDNKLSKWFYSEGFSEGSDNKRSAEFLTGKEYLLTTALSESGVDENKKGIIKAKFFSRPRNQELYEPPLLLIKKSLGKNTFVTAFRNQITRFKNRIIGISAPPEDKDELVSINEFLHHHHKLLFFFISGYSGEFLIRRSSAIQKDDIDILPYPEDINKIALSPTEEILVDDTLNYFLPFRREHAKLTKAEKAPTNSQLKEFGETYLQVLNSVYHDYKCGQWLETNSHIIYPFYWGEAPNLPGDPVEVENHLDSLMNFEQPSGSIRYKRVMRIYNENVIYLIKPKQLRYWLRSIALRDADETFASLVRQEYELSPA